MENNRKVTAFFAGVGVVLGILAATANITSRSWWPLLAFVMVLTGLGLVSLFHAALFVPLFKLISWLTELHVKNKTRKDGSPNPR